MADQSLPPFIPFTPSAQSAEASRYAFHESWLVFAMRAADSDVCFQSFSNVRVLFLFHNIQNVGRCGRIHIRFACHSSADFAFFAAASKHGHPAAFKLIAREQTTIGHGSHDAPCNVSNRCDVRRIVPTAGHQRPRAPSALW